MAATTRRFGTLSRCRRRAAHGWATARSRPSPSLSAPFSSGVTYSPRSASTYPTTWSVPPVEKNARSPVAVGALRLAILELQDSTRESGENTGYNVAKFTKRFGFPNAPWSAAFTTWAYGEALKRVAESPDVHRPWYYTHVFADPCHGESSSVARRSRRATRWRCGSSRAIGTTTRSPIHTI